MNHRIAVVGNARNTGDNSTSRHRFMPDMGKQTRASDVRFATATLIFLLAFAACAPAATPSSSTRSAADPSTTGLSGTPPPTSSPLAIGPVDSQIAAGDNHTCTINDRGGVSCWGAFNGWGDVNGSYFPVDVPGLTSQVVALAPGQWHTCALTATGGVVCWGANDQGQLGDGTQTPSVLPVNVSGLTNGVTAIASGGSHTCAVTGAGAVTCWGVNEQGQLGVAVVTISPVPVEVSGLASGVIAVAVGGNHSCALMIAGGVKCWGANGNSQLGDGTTAKNHVPVDVVGLASGVSAVVAGGEHTCALMTAGGIKCWGDGDAGELGNGAFVDSGTPVDVTGLSSGVTAVSAGGGHTCALLTSGGVRCWGSDGLGIGSSEPSALPVDVVGLGGRAIALAAGALHTCALMSVDVPMCWGDNYLGQLGLGTRCAVNSEVPARVTYRESGSGNGSDPSPAVIEHATGPTDVLLRFDEIVNIRDVLAIIEDDAGRWFAPGAEFTLYGDGTAIARNDVAPQPPGEGPIVRATPFRIARLDEDQIEVLLGYALDEGGLRDACDEYGYRGGDNDKYPILTIRAGGLDRRIQAEGPSPLGPLMDRLRNFGSGDGFPSQVFTPDRYVGSLVDVGPLTDVEAVPWPWPSIAPGAFVVPAEYAFIAVGHRIMSAKEASVLGLSANGGVVQRIYLRAPTGTTVYAFSMRPMLPDDPG